MAINSMFRWYQMQLYATYSCQMFQLLAIEETTNRLKSNGIQLFG